MNGIAPWLRLAHVLGVVVYAGGVVLESRILLILADAAEGTRGAIAASARRAYLWLVLPFGALMAGSGIYLLVADPEERGYLRDPAFHAKLTLVLVLVIVEHVMVIRPLKAIAAGKADAARGRTLWKAAHPVVLLLVFAILLALLVLRAPAKG